MKSIVAMQAMFFQGLAAICTVLTTYYISTKLGASGQGEWALLKSNVEFIAALMSFGFPISYTFYINKKKSNYFILLRQYFIYLIVVSPLIYLMLKLEIIEVKSSMNLYIVEYMVVMGVLISIYSNFRGVMLASYSLLMFNFISFFLPAVILMTFFLYNLSEAKDIVFGYFYSCIIIFLGSLLLMFFGKTENKVKNTTNIWGFYKYSVWNFISNIGPYLYIIIINQWLLMNGFTYHDLGLVSVVILIQGSILLVPNVLGPLLYRNWSNDNNSILATYRKTLFMFVLISIMIVISLIPIMGFLIVNLLGDEFITTISLIKILMLSIPFSFAIRVLLNACLSVGAAKEYAIATNVKNLFVLISFLTLKPNELKAVISIMAAFEVLTFVFLAFLSKRHFNCSIWFLLGLKKYAD